MSKKTAPSAPGLVFPAPRLVFFTNRLRSRAQVFGTQFYFVAIQYTGMVVTQSFVERE